MNQKAQTIFEYTHLKLWKISNNFKWYVIFCMYVWRNNYDPKTWPPYVLTISYEKKKLFWNNISKYKFSKLIFHWVGIEFKALIIILRICISFFHSLVLHSGDSSSGLISWDCFPYIGMMYTVGARVMLCPQWIFLINSF